MDPKSENPTNLRPSRVKRAQIEPRLDTKLTLGYKKLQHIPLDLVDQDATDSEDSFPDASTNVHPRFSSHQHSGWNRDGGSSLVAVLYKYVEI